MYSGIQVALCRGRLHPYYFRGLTVLEVRRDRSNIRDMKKFPYILQGFSLLFQLEISDGQVADFLEEMANYLECHLAALDAAFFV